MATAELALAIPAVVMVLWLCLAGLTLSVDQIRCVDAARTAARAASRGYDVGQVRLVGQSLTPTGTEVSVTFLDEADAVQVAVTAPPRVQWLPMLPRASSVATAPREPVTSGS
ncbi:MAG: TadE family type IV pilus minor pilin [Ornithinimicrobium sp.]